jgi:hypothetical protein
MEDRLNARSAGNVATISFVAGAVLVGAGATLFIVGAPKSREVSLRIEPLPMGAALHGSF